MSAAAPEQELTGTVRIESVFWYVDVHVASESITPDVLSVWPLRHPEYEGEMAGTFAPYVTDWIHRELTGESVHLVQQYGPDRADAPSADAKALDEAMSAIRALASAGRAARETAKVNVRQPLSRMVCVTGPLSAAAQALVPELVPILRETGMAKKPA